MLDSIELFKRERHATKLMDKTRDMWDAYNEIEKNTLKQITGDSMKEKLQKANQKVNQNLQTFMNSDEYKDLKKDMEAEFGQFYLNISRFPNAESHFYMYIDDQKMDYIETAESDEEYAIIRLDTGDDVFMNDPFFRPCSELEGANRITVGYEDKFPLNDFNGYEQNYVSGQDLYNMMCKVQDKSVKVSKSRGNMAETALHVNEDTPEEEKKKNSPAD